jgi:hypothetical protein
MPCYFLAKVGYGEGKFINIFTIDKVLIVKLLKDIKTSGPARFTKALALQKFTGYKTRKLKDEEISQLKSDLNYSENWDDILVHAEFKTGRIRNCTFSGHVCLPNFFGNVLGPDGVHIPTGLYHSHFNNVYVENCHVSQVSMVSNQVLSQGVILRNVGSISHVGISRFAIGANIQIGSETGQRLIPMVPGLELNHVNEMLTNMGDSDKWDEFLSELKTTFQEFDASYGFIGKDSIITNTLRVKNSWIGESTRIDGATKVNHCCLIGAMEQPISIKDGAIVEYSILHWGTKVKANAQVSDSLLMESSSAASGAKVYQSIIGPNTHIEQGEVSHSFLGPFIGFHHQSLLISTLWPDGMGNVAHGACIGSNHTGKRPSQELLPGRGMFFGLNSKVSFPGNYTESPWSLVATDVHLPPQKVSMPFSLFVKNGDGVKILPGWMIGYNAYALSRNSQKFKSRNKCRRQTLQLEFLEKKTLKMVVRAYKALKSVKIKLEYTSRDVEGLGQSLLTEVDRQKALSFYYQILERAFYQNVMDYSEKNADRLKAETSVKKILNTEILKELSKIIEVPDHLLLAIKRHRTVEKNWFDLAQSGLIRERERGREIIEDYDVANPEAEDLKGELFNDLEYANIRVKSLLASLK